MGGAVAAAAAPADLALDVGADPLESFGPARALPSPPSAPLPPPQSRVLAFRALTWRDIPQVRALHEEWFPIRYNDSFYDGAAQGLWAETGGPMLARVAVELTDACVEVPNAPILGAVTASTLPLSKVDDPDLIARGDRRHTHVMYILTLGARRSARRGGIASALIQQCLEHARAQRHCGAVYLHVKADNEGARRFYEKNGFRNLRFLPDYYLIDGVRHDAFLYIHYVNDAAPEPGWLDLLARPFTALLSIASFGWRRILDGVLGPDDDEEEQQQQASIHQRDDHALQDAASCSAPPSPPSGASYV